jgi:hypothetical protein
MELVSNLFQTPTDLCCLVVRYRVSNPHKTGISIVLYVLFITEVLSVNVIFYVSQVMPLVEKVLYVSCQKSRNCEVDAPVPALQVQYRSVQYCSVRL